MCLGEVGRVVRLLEDRRVEVRTPERTLIVSLIALEGDLSRSEVSSGAWLLVHAGFALERLGADEAAAALALRSYTEVPT